MRVSVFNLLAESFLKRYVVKERSLVLLLSNAEERSSTQVPYREDLPGQGNLKFSSSAA
jgi:hypothetical protein